MDLTHRYIEGALGFGSLVQIHEHEARTIPMKLLRAASLLSDGDKTGCGQLLIEIEALQDWDNDKWGSFLCGLRELSNGQMQTSYDYFLAAMDSTDPAQTVIAGRQASMIAFSMADAKKSLEAATKLGPLIETQPYAGGILAFAQHNAEHPDAEQTARKAISAGFADAWTLHAIAHCLYVDGKADECVQWLADGRDLISDCGIFMRIHFEFHLALALVDLQEGEQLNALCAGTFWGGCTAEEKADYWTHTGVLNALWKAQLRGVEFDPKFVAEALASVEGVDVEMSPVFSLCVLRWTRGAVRQQWLTKIVGCTTLQAKADVYKSLAKAVDLVYPDGEVCNEGSPKWTEAATMLSPFTAELSKLGGSAEQREVLEDFIAIIGLRGNQPESEHINLSGWLEVNHRPGIAFYDTVQQGLKRKR